MSSQTHQAVCTIAARAPLEIRHLATVPPGEGEVKIRNEWTASTPLDLHQADGGLLVNHPQVLGDGVAGIVVEVGSGVKRLAVGDKVFGFTWRTQQEKAQQEFVTAPEYLLDTRITLIPRGSRGAQQPGNSVPRLFERLRSTLPWPKPDGYSPPNANDPILIWGGSSSVGQYALQILRFFGYNNLLATASKQHHDLLKSFGAAQCFDYRDPDVTSAIVEAAKLDRSASGRGPVVPFILDCIGSVSSSVKPIAKIATSGSKVAILLPFIVKDASETEPPEYAMDAQAVTTWAEGVEPSGVRTHFYLENEFFKNHLQAEVMPYLLENGVVKPNKQRIVEGANLLERAQSALNILRRKEVSGERLVWRVAT